MCVWTYRRHGIDLYEDNGQLLSEVVDPGISMSFGIADQEIRLPFAEFVILSIQARRTLTSPGQNGQL
ncbi:hypothetical protein QCA50_019652 [Cerrena zonata]|uniref:Uncharacterized protein n=1 Tax=Cerrena zonata TaxID=2478898 RepID=A0AAW0FJE5_9APHY